METLFVAVLALLGLRLGLRAIGDNSTFVHLRTGIDMVDGLGIPRRDPYSFTAPDVPWVVQSWFASLVYGVLERAAGMEAVVAFHGIVYAAVAWLVASLARTGSAVRTAGAAIVAMGIGMPFWSPRPLAIGLLAMAVTVIVVERRLPPWILVPTAWVWVNSHGSFALGLVWLAVVVVAGRREARSYLTWFAAGVLAGAVNPIGPRLLVFPAQLVSKRANFTRVVEWRPPFSPTTPFAVFGLVCVALAILLVALAARRDRLQASDVAPATVFIALGLVAQRNLAPAAIVLAPVLARALAAGARAAAPARPSVNRAFAAVLVAIAALFTGTAAMAEPLDASGYPTDAAFAATGGAERIVSTDVVGGYRILREGRAAGVFVDDRYDMYPHAVIAAFVQLLDGAADSAALLDRYRADAVIWPENEELAALLGRSPEWRRVFRDDAFVVFVRTG